MLINGCVLAWWQEGVNRKAVCMRRGAFACVWACAAIGLTGVAQGQVTVISEFDLPGSFVGLGYDATTDSLWLYPSFGGMLQRYSTTGTFLGMVPRPAESADDADVEFAPTSLQVGATTVPAGTLLFINGESGPAEIHAIDKASGAVLASLSTAFGNSHVVGGAYHPTRGTFFLVQDRQVGSIDGSRIGEINPVSGAVLNTFRTTDVDATFTVNFGDLDIGPNGNLYIVSSDETRILELTPSGALVTTHALPTGVTSLCGVGINGRECRTWVTSTAGVVSQLAGVLLSCAPCLADFNRDGVVNSQDFFDFLAAFFGGLSSADFNGDMVTNSQDFFDFVAAFFTGC